MLNSFDPEWGWLVSTSVTLFLFAWALRVERQKAAAVRGATLSWAAALSLFVGLASTLIALHFGAFRGFTPGIVAVGAGVFGLYRIQNSEGRRRGVLMAVTGIVLGGLQSIWFFLALAVLTA